MAWGEVRRARDGLRGGVPDTMPTDELSELQEVLEARGIQTMRAVPTDRRLVALSMSTYSVQEFLNAIAPGPIEGDDFEARIVGRPQDLTVDQEPWRFEVVPSVRDAESGIQLHVIVNMPASDVGEVLRRLGR